MIPEMPALIPANCLIQRPRANTEDNLQLTPGLTEPHLQQPGYRISPSDEQLHKDLDDQIQLVKQLQTKLGTEMM